MYEPPDASSSAIASSGDAAHLHVVLVAGRAALGPEADDDIGAHALHLVDDPVDELLFVDLGHAAVGVVPHHVAVDAEVEAVLQRLGPADVAEILVRERPPGSGGRPRPAVAVIIAV